MTDLHAVVHTDAERGAARRGASGRQKNTEQKDWTIKGIPTETVEVTREAAKASGMKINAWVSQALADAACISPSKLISSASGVLELDQAHISELENLRARNDELVQTVHTLSTLLAKSLMSK